MIQQRQGRVRGSGSGLSVVQDRVLEAEADRMGMRAASHGAPVQAKAPAGGVRSTMTAVPGLVHAGIVQRKKKGPNPVRAAAAARAASAAATAVAAPAQDTQMTSGAPLSATSTGGATSGGNGVHATADGKPYSAQNMSSTAHHAEAQICKAWKADVAAIKKAQGAAKATEAAQVARSISIDAWPCGTCDTTLANTARDLGCKITVTVTEDYGLYSRDHGHTAGLKGTITYG